MFSKGAEWILERYQRNQSLTGGKVVKTDFIGALLQSDRTWLNFKYNKEECGGS